MDDKVIQSLGVGATQEAQAPGAEEGEHAKPALDGLRFHDQTRFLSSEVTRAFASATRAVWQGPQSEVSEPDEVMLDPDVAISDQDSIQPPP